jgi:dTDP-4-dehydrorhamnose reductase
VPDPIPYRIAVTGSNGQLGKEFARIAGNHPSLQFTFLPRSVFPLDDPEKMKAWVDQHPVDIFINCAAYTAVDKAESETEKAFQINATAPGLLAGMLSAKSTSLIHISTDYVFDGKSHTPLPETAVTEPLNQYGKSKLEGERLIMKNNPASQVIRTSWLYSSFGNNFVKTMLRLMKEKETVQVVQDQLGSPTYAGDLASAILHMIRSGHFIPGIYHYSNEGETTWYEFAMEIKNLTGSNCRVVPIPASDYPTPASRPAYSLLDKTKIKKDYGLVIPDWKTSLSFCIELIRRQGV